MSGTFEHENSQFTAVPGYPIPAGTMKRARFLVFVTWTVYEETAGDCELWLIKDDMTGGVIKNLSDPKPTTPIKPPPGSKPLPTRLAMAGAVRKAKREKGKELGRCDTGIIYGDCPRGKAAVVRSVYGRGTRGYHHNVVAELEVRDRLSGRRAEHCPSAKFTLEMSIDASGKTRYRP
jgi:hypothetical protein